MTKLQSQPLSRRPRVQITFEKPSLAKQSMKDECDINKIMSKFEKHGVMDHYNEYKGSYGDFADHPAYHDAMNIMTEANEMFETIPAGIRKQFGNDPSAFLEFAQNPDNQDKLIKMGLAKAPQQQPRVDNPTIPEKNKNEPAALDPEKPST